jgi:hypothetical protein
MEYLSERQILPLEKHFVITDLILNLCKIDGDHSGEWPPH